MTDVVSRVCCTLPRLIRVIVLYLSSAIDSRPCNDGLAATDNVLGGIHSKNSIFKGSNYNFMDTAVEICSWKYWW